MSEPSIRSLLTKGEVLYAPGVWGGLSAKLAEKAGFKALCSSGYAISASLGMPDAELYTASENLGAVQRIRQGSRLPLVADIDTGYGNAVNVRRTVRMFEDAGATALFMEDQVAPKRCPICVGDPVPVLPLEEAVGKVRAAVEARHSPDTVIIARTDSSGDDAMRRAEAYAAAGADLIMPVTKTFSSIEEWAKCSDAVGNGLVATLTSNTWVEKEFSEEVLKELDVRLALIPTQGIHVAAEAILNAFTLLSKGGRPTELANVAMPHMQFISILGFPEVEELQQRYLPKAEA